MRNIEQSLSDFFHSPQLCDLLPLPVVMLDRVRRILYINGEAESLLNISANMANGKPLDALIPLDAAWEALLRQASEGQRSVKANALPFHGGRVNVHAATTPPDGLALIIEPLDGKLESHASRQTSMRSAAVMADILIHELRNPLSGIRGAAQLLQTSAVESDRELLGLICKEVDRIGTLLTQVEYFSTEQPIAKTAVNIHEVLRHVSQLLQQSGTTGIQWVEEYDPSLPPVAGNSDLLVQALLNIAKNAMEAVSGTPSPVICLKTSYRSGYRMDDGGKTVSLPICVQVIDNGPGIPETHRENIFTPFVTHKVNGKGLGLPIVAKILSDHGGVIELESAEKGHTVFTMQLPAWTDATKTR